jgi:hypothetical protein
MCGGTKLGNRDRGVRKILGNDGWGEGNEIYERKEKILAEDLRGRGCPCHWAQKMGVSDGVWFTLNCDRM